MKVINLNSRYDLTKVQIAFAQDMLSLENLDCDFRMEFPYNFNMLMEKVPVFLINEDTMREWERMREIEYPDAESPATEWLGFYAPRADIMRVEHPLIALCPERIIGCVKNDVELCWLIAKILIHEFAHAAMDQTQYGRHDKFYLWVEEPMANLLTLEVIQAKRDSYRYRLPSYPSSYPHINDSENLTTGDGIYDMEAFYEYAKNFMRNQPANYSIAVHLHEKRFFHSKHWDWARSKESWRKLTWQKQLWLDYWQKVTSHRIQNNDIVAYEIWRSFDINYAKFKQLLSYFCDAVAQAKNITEEQVREDIRYFENHLYGDFRIDLQNQEISWEYYNTLCNIKMRYQQSNQEFEIIDANGTLCKSFSVSALGLKDKEPNDQLKDFLDNYTEIALRSMF